MNNKRTFNFFITDKNLVYVAAFLLALNLLLYAFFKVDINKNIIRAACAFVCLLVFIGRGKIKLFDLIALLVPAYLILINGDVSINVAFMLIMAIAMKSIEKDKILSTYNKVHILIFAVVVFALLSGLVSNESWTYLGRTRNSLGFIHVNYAGLLAFSLIAIYLMQKESINWKDYTISVGLSYLIYRYTDSRTGFYGTIILLLLIIGFQLMPKRFIKITSFVISIAAFASPIAWKQLYRFTFRMNTLLSLRPEIFSRYIDSNTFYNFIFGGSIAGEIDNAFLLMLYNCGTFIYVGIAFIVIKSIANKIESKEYVEVAFILSTLAIAMMESSLLRPEIPCMTFFWITVLADLRNRNKETIPISGDN